MRRPTVRSLVGGAAGIATGIASGLALTTVSSAGPPPASAPPALIEVAHVPPLLRLPGEGVRLRYSIVCSPRGDGGACDGSGSVYVASVHGGAFRRLPLRRDDDSREGRYYADVSADLAADPAGFAYYAILRDDATGASTTLPPAGAATPQLSLPLAEAATVHLGEHEFGRVRVPEAHVVDTAWGSGPGEVGLAGTRELGFSGPSSFDVEPDGAVDVLDSVNGRVLRWQNGRAQPVSLGGVHELADFAVEADGSYDVLDPHGALRHFRRDGRAVWTQQLAERTWAKLAHGAGDPVVLQQPSEQWLPLAHAGAPLSRGVQIRAAHAGLPLPNGHQILVDRVGTDELRISEVAGQASVRAWRITSRTPLGEVQLAETAGTGLVAVTRTYTDDRDEFVVLLLESSGSAHSFSVASDSWTETAPLARFRLAGGALYRLRTTPAGATVDRFDLEVPR
jgi:hypothetical protein